MTVVAPELRLLLASTRLEMTPAESRAANEAIALGVDWARVVTMARHHGLLPLLHRQLAAGCVDPQRVPPAIRDEIAAEATRIARRNLRSSADLVAIIRALRGRGIAVMPLKGVVLAQHLYGSIALRPIRDLDILCAPEQLDEAMNCLAALGYRRAVPPTHPRTDERSTEHHLSLHAPSPTIPVELHFRLFHRSAAPRVDLDSLAGRLRPAVFGGIEISDFAPEDLLVYLCIHGAVHGWERLEWVCGVAELLRGERIRDWPRVASWAEALRARRRVALALRLAVDLLDAPVPPLALEGGAIARPVRRVLSRITRDPLASPTAGERLALGLATDASPRDRVARCWHVLVSPKWSDVAAVRVPDFLWPVYYAVRPIRLATRALRSRRRLARPMDARDTGGA